MLSVIYGLNPFILLEGIANVHNDIYVVFFVLASLYFLLRKKNLFLSVIILAISAAVKYVTILLLPFIIIYYFRKEKKLSARFLNCIKYGLVFILFIGATYLVYVQNLDVLGGIIDQQGKYTKSLQTMLIFHGYTDLEMLQKGLMLMFFVICIMMGMNSITKKYISFSFAIKQYNILLCLLLPLIITNFEPWYLMWLFPTMMLQSGKAVKQAIGISLTSQVANCMFMLHGEDWHYTDQFVIIMITGIIITLILTSNKMKKEES